MRRSKSEIYLHFVWATHRRLPLITPAMQSALYGFITEEAQRLGCDLLALGGVADHVHLLLKMPPKRCPSLVMQQIKGASSAWVRSSLRPQQLVSAEPFGWQDNYGVFSVRRTHLQRVTAYVDNQEQHHATGEVFAAWEELTNLANGLFPCPKHSSSEGRLLCRGFPQPRSPRFPQPRQTTWVY